MMEDKASWKPINQHPSVDVKKESNPMRRCFVLRDKEVRMKDIRSGDIFRLQPASDEDSNCHESYNVAIKDGEIFDGFETVIVQNEVFDVFDQDQLRASIRGRK